MERSFSIADRVKLLREQIAAAAASSGRSLEEITLMAVTKTVSPERVNESIAAGITLLGENRAQELAEKYDAYDTQHAAIHFIGHLQTNKVKTVIDRVSMIESVDRLSLAAEINRLAGLRNRKMPILIEVNIAAEESKSGVLPEKLPSLLEEISQLPHLSVEGLLAIPPKVGSDFQKEKYFEQMYQHFIDIRSKNMDNITMNTLSMGMSEDFPLAIRQGSTIVRIGRGLFGERQ